MLPKKSSSCSPKPSRISQVVAARLEQEERRKEKHRKMEAEREKMREGIRSKVRSDYGRLMQSFPLQYNIQKKEEGGAGMDFGTDGRIGAARKKTPEELAAEMNAEDDSMFSNLSDYGRRPLMMIINKKKWECRWVYGRPLEKDESLRR